MTGEAVEQMNVHFTSRTPDLQPHCMMERRRDGERESGTARGGGGHRGASTPFDFQIDCRHLRLVLLVLSLNEQVLSAIRMLPCGIGAHCPEMLSIAKS